MMDRRQALMRVAAALAECSIPYMLVGGVASSYYGEPRSIVDIDIVLDPPSGLADFSRALRGDFFIDEGALPDALDRRSMFSILPRGAAIRVDLILSKGADFERSQFSRRQTNLWRGRPIDFVSPEDCILRNLDWAKRCRAEQQFRDALGVCVKQWKSLEMPYLREWAAALDLGDWLSKLEEQAGKLRVSEEAKPPEEKR